MYGHISTSLLARLNAASRGLTYISVYSCTLVTLCYLPNSSTRPISAARRVNKSINTKLMVTSIKNSAMASSRQTEMLNWSACFLSYLNIQVFHTIMDQRERLSPRKKIVWQLFFEQSTSFFIYLMHKANLFNFSVFKFHLFTFIAKTFNGWVVDKFRAGWGRHFF